MPVATADVVSMLKAIHATQYSELIYLQGENACIAFVFLVDCAASSFQCWIMSSLLTERGQLLAMSFHAGAMNQDVLSLSLPLVFYLFCLSPTKYCGTAQ